MIKKGLNQYPSWTQKIVWVKLTNTDSYLTVKKRLITIKNSCAYFIVALVTT